MNRACLTLDAEVTVAAVLSRIAMPAAEIAALEPGDVLETEPEVGNHPLVRLTVGATTVAWATVAKVDGRLIATIIETRTESGQKGDPWILRKANQVKD